MAYPSWQDTLLALHRAGTLEELWGVLVSPHGIRSSSEWDEPLFLFRRFHGAESDNHPDNDADKALISAALICTDQRWRKAVCRLILHLADSEIFSEHDLDRLAETFLQSQFTIEVNERNVQHRQIWPPLRRWAAAQQVKLVHGR